MRGLAGRLHRPGKPIGKYLAAARASTFGEFFGLLMAVPPNLAALPSAGGGAPKFELTP